MPKCYQLIGVPASGKSTWYKNQDWLGEDKKEHKYVSTDYHVEVYAKEQGKTYSEVFAVVFRTPDLTVLKERLANRPGKEVPWEVVQGMIDNWEQPTHEEGFKEIWYAN